MSEENRAIEAGQTGASGGADAMEDAKSRQALIDAHVKSQVRTIRRVVLIAGAFLLYCVWFMLHQ